MAARCDVDVYMRGCRVLENWDVNQMGGVRRRRGMRYVRDAESVDSRLVAYEYTHEDEYGCFLVELDAETILVMEADGHVVAEFESGQDGVTEFRLELAEVRTCQVNALLFITCRSCWPLVLRWDGYDTWTLKRMDFKHLPWRYDHEKRERAVVVSARRGLGMEYDVAFAEDEKEDELPMLPDEEDTGVEDTLRASFWLEQAEAKARGVELRSGVRTMDAVGPCGANERVALKGETSLRYWVCIKEFPADVYAPGLDDPGSYPDNFAEAETDAGFEDAREVTSVKQLGTVGVDTKFAVRSGYWEYFTCIKAFTRADMVEGLESFSDYQEHFVRGIAVGEALPCKGKWSFYCSGLWYGSYEVRRSYDGSDLTAEWESAGISFSRLSEAENTQLSGDEADEECWLRLFLTRSKRVTDELVDGFPPDSCGNRLIVDGYKHDMLLHLDEYGVWTCVDPVDIGWTGTRTVYDWSWAAFGERYGYPLECDMYQQRLVLASTVEQPQSLWMSQVDDYYNFATGDSDAAAIYLTLYTTSQDPVCWMLEDRGRLLLGTSNAEWVIESRDGVVRPGGLNVSRHGRIGSMNGMMLAAEDKALYVERGGARLWEFGYSFEVDGCRSRDLTVFAPHVLREHGGVRSATLLRKPDTVAVFALEDGQVALMTYNTMHEVHAWHRWVTDGRVLSVCALPAGQMADRLYLIVQRGREVYIEVVDEQSVYEDTGRRAYASTLVTNALGNPLEELVQKRPKTPAMVLLGAELDTRQLEVCADGGSWAKVVSPALVLPTGWHQFLVFNRWEVGHALGIRVTGDGASILALQG